MDANKLKLKKKKGKLKLGDKAVKVLKPRKKKRGMARPAKDPNSFNPYYRMPDQSAKNSVRG